MNYSEALRELYIERAFVKLPEWGGCWYVNAKDGLIHELVKGDGDSIVSSARLGMFADRTDFTSSRAISSFKIIRHKNPKGKTTWYRAVYYDEKGRAHKSSIYNGNLTIARRNAQNWLYANTEIWCKIATVEQRVVTPDGVSTIVIQGTEAII